jgi:hypothetical protein
MTLLPKQVKTLAVVAGFAFSAFAACKSNSGQIGTSQPESDIRTDVDFNVASMMYSKVEGNQKEFDDMKYSLVNNAGLEVEFLNNTKVMTVENHGPNFGNQRDTTIYELDTKTGDFKVTRPVGYNAGN